MNFGWNWTRVSAPQKANFCPRASGFETIPDCGESYRDGTRRITRLAISSGVERVKDPCSGAELLADTAALLLVWDSRGLTTAAGGTSTT